MFHIEAYKNDNSIFLKLYLTLFSLLAKTLFTFLCFCTKEPFALFVVVLTYHKDTKSFCFIFFYFIYYGKFQETLHLMIKKCC